MAVNQTTPSWSSDSSVPVIDRIILDVCELTNNPLPGMGQDDVWLSLDDLRAILERHISK